MVLILAQRDAIPKPVTSARLTLTSVARNTGTINLVLTKMEFLLPFVCAFPLVYGQVNTPSPIPM